MNLYAPLAIAVIIIAAIVGYIYLEKNVSESSDGSIGYFIVMFIFAFAGCSAVKYFV